MFWSKIWLFLVAIAAAAALTIALAFPRSAHHARLQDERQRLVVACGVVKILLENKAHTDVGVVLNFSRDDNLRNAVVKAGASATLAAKQSPSLEVFQEAKKLMDKVDDDKPELGIVTDAGGRVIARIGLGEETVGDVVAGRWLLDDALAGYLRDDVWVEEDNLYLVGASPIVQNNVIVGSAVLGWRLDTSLADGFVRAFRDAGVGGKRAAADDGEPGDVAAEQRDGEDRSVHVAFYAQGIEGLKVMTKSTTRVMLDTDMIEQYGKLEKPDSIAADCREIAPFYARDGRAEYAAVLSRIPGEAEYKDAYYTVFTTRPAATSFSGAISKAKGELGGGFPWAVVVVVFVLGFGGGVGLMIVEADRPLRRLQADAVRLAKGERERLAEDDHGGRFGSIARSVNIQVDKLTRDAKAAKKDLDQLLGPAPEGSLGALDLLGGAPLPSRPAIPIPGSGPTPAPASPPPSEFRFSEQATARAKPGPAPELDLGAPRPPAAPATAPARPPLPVTPARPKPPIPSAVREAPPSPAPPKRIDDDILSTPGEEFSGMVTAIAPGITEEAYFREVFEQFLELKRKCGEPTVGLTFQKFGDKLRKNRDELMAKTGCAEVRFTVYVKDGKAALKATPVKDGG